MRVESHGVLRENRSSAVLRRSAAVASLRAVSCCRMAQSRSRLDVRRVVSVLGDFLRFGSSTLRPRVQLAAENLFLRKQFALYVERDVRPRRADDATRLTLVGLSRLIDSRHWLVVVKPATLIRWHRTGFRLSWRWKSRQYGRPRLPADVRQLIAERAATNCTWGEERLRRNCW
jgi:putative transposase